jgi:hypothetical protein
LKYYGGWSFIEAYNLPVGLRKWFVERLTKQLKTEEEAMNKGRGNKKPSMPSRGSTPSMPSGLPKP